MTKLNVSEKSSGERLLDKAGSMFRELLSDKWRKPRKVGIDSSGKYLVWGDVFEDVGPSTVTPIKMLNDFKGLSICGDDSFGREVKRFAEHYGVLGLCQHGKPYTHIKTGYYDAGFPRYCWPHPNKEGMSSEKLERWRYYAQLVEAVVSLSDSLNKGKLGDPDKWLLVRRELHDGEDFEGLRELKILPEMEAPKSRRQATHPDPDSSRVGLILSGALNTGKQSQRSSSETINWKMVARIREIAEKHVREEKEKVALKYTPEDTLRALALESVHSGKREIALVLNWLLEITDTRPRLTWNNKEKRFALTDYNIGKNLLSIITTQLLLIVSGSTKIAQCADCHTLFLLREHQSPLKNAYCDRCGIKGAWRKARERQKQLDKENPKRKKKKRRLLTEAQKLKLRQDWKKGFARESQKRTHRGLIFRLAEKYKMSERHVRRIVGYETRNTTKEETP